MTTKDIPFPIIPPNREDDLHHLEFLDSPDLVLFMAGNQFMVMDDVIGAFQSRHPEIKKIFFETLPPGLELKQILAGGALLGDRFIGVVPDIYTSVSEQAMGRLEDAGLIEEGGYRLYLHNRVVLMVPEGNPAEIHSVRDLGRREVRISQPDPENEDIAYHTIEMYRRAGGEELVHRILDEKRMAGTTLLTAVHHRETPQRIAEGKVDVGPVWATEVIHAKRTHVSVDVVEPGKELDRRESVNYYICRLRKSSHPENAERFIEFILSVRAQQTYQAYGFVPHVTV